MTKRRVVVTGMGLISPIGHTVEESWQAAVAGRSGIGLNESFDTTDYSVKICGSVRDFDISTFMNPKEARRIDEFIQLASLLAQATQDLASRRILMMQTDWRSDWFRNRYQ